MTDFQSKVQAEIKRQQEIFGDSFDATNTTSDWITYITRTASRSFTKLPDGSATNLESFAADMVKVAALAESAYNSIQRKE